MADEENTNSPEMSEGGEDQFKNLKSEFNRKLENQEKQFEAVNAALQNIAQSLESSRTTTAAPAPATSGFDSNLEALQYSDPVKYAEIIKNQAKQEALKEFQSYQMEQSKRQQATQAKQNAIIAEITREFPEATQAGHPLYDKVQEMYKSLPPDKQNDSSQWESVVYKAAFEVGVKPRSKRSSDDPNDGFVVAGSGGFPKGGNKQAANQSAVTEGMLQFAQLLGRPVEDENYRKSLEKAAKRPSWTRYQ